MSCRLKVFHKFADLGTKFLFCSGKSVKSTITISVRAHAVALLQNVHFDYMSAAIFLGLELSNSVILKHTLSTSSYKRA